MFAFSPPGSRAHPVDPTPNLSLRTAADFLAALTDETVQACLTGKNAWNFRDQPNSLADFDPALADLVQRWAPSKRRPTEGLARDAQPSPTHHSLWSLWHFEVLLPGLHRVNAAYLQDPKTSKLPIGPEALAFYFPPVAAIVNHHREDRELRDALGPRTAAWWDDVLGHAFARVTANTPLVFARAQIDALPGPLAVRAKRLLDGEGPDTLQGRTVLAYLYRQGVEPAALRIDGRTGDYLGATDLYTRLRDVTLALGQLDDPLQGCQPDEPLPLGAALAAFNWYARPRRVETVLPGLVGAAEFVAERLIAFYANLTERGYPDHTNLMDKVPDPRPSLGSLGLRNLGRLSLVLDLTHPRRGNGQPGGEVVRAVLSRFCTEAARREAWGHVGRYVPDDRGDFITFRQDVADVLFCAGLVERGVGQAAGDAALAERLSELAWQVTEANTLDALRARLREKRDLVNQWAQASQARHPGTERAEIARFVQRSFGLLPSAPVPIPFAEITRGFAGSTFHRHRRLYEVRFQEGKDHLALRIKIPAEAFGRGRAIYRTLWPGEAPRTTREGLPCSAWLEVFRQGSDCPVIVPVPGRGSLDPFGRVGSLHGGEVVGYGCSVHHASLAVVLAELASLGVGRNALERVAEKFLELNRGYHERRDLARFQVAAVWAAFAHGEEFSFAAYLRDGPGVEPDRDRPHLEAYRRDGTPSLAWADGQVARLGFAYRTLYPADPGSACALDPRSAGYDDRDWRLEKPGKLRRVEWQAVAESSPPRVHRPAHTAGPVPPWTGHRGGPWPRQETASPRAVPVGSVSRPGDLPP